MKQAQEEVGDLFITEKALTVKLHPSRKSRSKPIRWYAGGIVTDRRSAVKDIASLVGSLQSKTRVVRGLIVMTDKGLSHDLDKSGILKAVSEAGFKPLN